MEYAYNLLAPIIFECDIHRNVYRNYVACRVGANRANLMNACGEPWCGDDDKGYLSRQDKDLLPINVHQQFSRTFVPASMSTHSKTL